MRRTLSALAISPIIVGCSDSGQTTSAPPTNPMPTTSPGAGSQTSSGSKLAKPGDKVVTPTQGTNVPDVSKEAQGKKTTVKDLDEGANSPVVTPDAGMDVPDVSKEKPKS